MRMFRPQVPVGGGALRTNFVGLCCAAAVLAVSAVGGSSAQSAQTYEYDLRGRLKTITYADGSVIHFDYDLHGNRTARTVTLGSLPLNSAPVWVSGATHGVAENSASTGYTAYASDADGDSVAYSIVGGLDASAFAINSSSGALSFASAPDFENPTDSGSNNVYDVILRANDGALTADLAVAVTVTDLSEQANSAPVWVSSTTSSVAENAASTVYTANATDADGDAVTYSIAGGADGAKFSINATTGALVFVSVPDFESPSDSGGNNVYNLTLRASDGALTADRAVAITVTGVNDNSPVWVSSAAQNVAENSVTTGYTASASDADGDAVSYSIVGGADASKFSINGTTGALSFVSAPDYESPTDSGGNNVYNVTLRASDGILTSDRAVAVAVTDVVEQTNSPPNAVNDSYTASAGQLHFFAVLQNDTDPDGDTLTITNVSVAGKGTTFVSGNTIQYGAYQFASEIDTFTYTVSDGNGGTDTATVVVNISGGGGLPF